MSLDKLIKLCELCPELDLHKYEETDKINNPLKYVQLKPIKLQESKKKVKKRKPN